jgi:hypothetical protein
VKATCHNPTVRGVLQLQVFVYCISESLAQARQIMPLARSTKALPLESFSLAVLPKTTHSITWSPDDELAIACDDCVIIYVPDFSRLPASKSARSGYDGPRQYDEAALRFPIAPLKDAQLNQQLFDAVNQEFSGYTYFTGAGSGVISGHGSSLNHTVALAWSPSGLGRMSRSVLAVLTAAGIITVYGQGASEVLGSGKVSRSLRPWVAVWHVGGGMLVPAAEGQVPHEDKEYITAFSWARDTQRKFAILSYITDDYEVVLLSVQAEHGANASPGHPGKWKVQEVARFMAEGPHPRMTDVSLVSKCQHIPANHFASKPTPTTLIVIRRLR